MKKIMFLSISLIFIIILGACSDEATNQDEDNEIKDTIEQYSLGNIQTDAANVAVTSHELVITEENDETETYPLPEDEFFVSIAPYQEITHPCDNHSLTSCQGELVEEAFDVLIKDTEGNVLIDESITSLKNGFIDLWLPRDEEFNVTIEHDGKIAQSEISTYKGDKTCITTMQLI